MKRGTRGMGRVYERGGVWWIAYHHDGKKVRESSKSPKKSAAVALLKRRHEALRLGRPHSEAAKVVLADLQRIIQNDYELQERRSGVRLAQSWAHLSEHFGDNEPAIRITGPRLGAYVTARLEEGAARGTVKNELNALRRSFRLAQRSGVLLANEVPVFPTIKTSDPRKGFFERAEHEAVKAALPPDAGDLAEFLFWTGWRTSEAKGLRWSNVDEAAGIIRIETSKSGEPRTLPYSALPALRELLEKRRAVTDAVQKNRGMVVAHVFARNGEPLREFRRSWKSACIAAGLGQEVRDENGKLVRKVALRTPHDYRRSAARNLSRAGVPEGVIMKLCGWKTRTVFDRYRIVAERDLAEGLARLAEAPPVVKASKVEPMKRASR